MPGFFITNTKICPKLSNYEEKNCVQRELRYNEWTIQWNVLNKYTDDKIFDDNEEFLIVLDGVILNKKELIKKYNMIFWKETFIKLIKERKSWLNELEGVFSGAILDKKNNKWICFTDQCGAHLIMTYLKNNMIAIGTQTSYFSEWMKTNDIYREIDNEWKRDMVWYGNTREAYSILKGVKRVYPGHYCLIDIYNKNIVEKKYYMVSKKIQTDLSEDDIIEELDKLFRNAIRKIINKDEEYGYTTLVDISGGLDSRMNAAIAKKEAKNHKLLGITYAQRGSDDDTISAEVANSLNIETLFYAMDNAEFLKDIDKLTLMNGGFNYYFGLTAAQRILSTINSDKMGIEIWGLLGDMYESTYSTISIDEDPKGTAKPVWSANSYRISKRFKIESEPGCKHEFEDNELLWYYVRGMIAGMNTGFIRQNYIEPITPYGDVEFMNFYFSIPYEIRTRNHICRKWMIKKYPEMADIVYSRTGVPVTERWHEKAYSKVRWLYRGICKRIFGIQRKEWSMNPFETWYKENHDVRIFIEKYYEDYKFVLNEDDFLKEKVSELYNKGNVMEKLLAVTIISDIKQYILS